MSLKVKKDFDSSKKAWSFILVGELNGLTAPKFEEEVKEAFKEKEGDVFLDFSEVTVFVSSAVGTLLILNDFIFQNDHRIVLKKSNPKIDEIISIIGIDALFKE